MFLVDGVPEDVMMIVWWWRWCGGVVVVWFGALMLQAPSSSCATYLPGTCWTTRRKAASLSTVVGAACPS